MRVEMKAIGELRPADYNPRVSLQPGMPAYERLKRSLDEFELVQPLVWNEQTGHVVGGHQRLTLLQEAGRTEVPVVVVSLSLEREKALNIALNNEQVAGAWDVEKLQDLLKDLIELPDFDETLTGFSEQEMNGLLLEPSPTFTEDDEEGKCESRVTVTLKVDVDDWDGVESELNDLLGQFEMDVHVKLPD